MDWKLHKQIYFEPLKVVYERAFIKEFTRINLGRSDGRYNTPVAC